MGWDDDLSDLLGFALVVTRGESQLAEDLVLDVLVPAPGGRRRRRAARGASSRDTAADPRRAIVEEYLARRPRPGRPTVVESVTAPGAGDRYPGGPLDTVAPRDWVALALRYVDGRGWAEVATILHCPETTARAAVTRTVEVLSRDEPAVTEADLGPMLASIAADAPDPARVTARLAARVRGRHQRRTVLRAAVVLGVGAAVGVPVLLALRRDPPVAQAPLLVRATWLPPGLVAYSRGASLDGRDGPEQVWTTADYFERLLAGAAGGTSPRVTLGATVVQPDSWYLRQDPYWTPRPGHPLPGPANATVGTRPAYVERTANSSVYLFTLSWLMDDSLLARLSAEFPPGSRVDDDLFRLAESIVVDRGLDCEAAIRPGWLPAMPPAVPPPSRWLLVSGSTRHQLQHLQKVPFDITLANTRAAVRSYAEAVPYTDVTVRGRTGQVRFVPFGSGIEPHGELRLDLADGRFLQIRNEFTYQLTEDEVRAATVRIADSLVIGPDPDLSFLGRPLS